MHQTRSPAHAFTLAKPAPIPCTRRWGRGPWFLAAALAFGTLVTFSPVWNCGFVNYDDDTYVTQNPHLFAGLTANSFAWAWTTTRAANWHPLTWLSLLLDAQLYGREPRGYHLTNLLLHVANSLLLFAVLRRMTGAAGRSALVAALFAVHPLHVESVAWVAERKDVLSTLLGLLALFAYVRYTEAPGLWRYLLVALGLVLSLLAKPMLVTLPCLLLVLDFWPLRRWAAGDKSLLGDKNAGAPSFSLGWLLLEKAPLLVLSAASSAATLWAQREGGAVKSLAQLPLSGRLANAAVSYLEYLRQMVLPVNLAAFYPHAGSELAPGYLWASILLLLTATILVLLCRRRVPYLTVGWLWYLGTLVPAIGLVQVGSQARADRYTYFPLVGIFLMLTWGVADLAVRWRRQRLAACAAALLLAYCMTASWLQVHNWQDSVTLWSHALEVTSESFVTHNNLGQALLEEGQVAQAAAHFEAALRLNPASTLAHYNRGFCYHLSGQLPEAIRHYREALRLDRNYVPAHSNLANALLLTGQPDEAVLHYREAVRLNPSNPRVHAGLGSALLRQGMLAEAVIHFQDALRLDPSLDDTYRDLGLALQLQEDWPQAADGFRHALDLRPENSEYHRSLAYCLERMGQTESARAEYQESLRLDPAWPQTVLREAWELATHTDTQRRNGRLAVQRAEQVLQGTGQRDPHTLDTLAAACAEAGQFTVAVATAREALAQAVAGSQTNLVKEIEQRLALYQKVQPFHAASP